MRQEKLIEFVKGHHGDQVRKYTGEPYFNHLYAVASEARKWGIVYGFEIGLCHDLLEDTACLAQELFEFLIYVGYSVEGAAIILLHVENLTDYFTKERFPFLNRKTRKACEARRLQSFDGVTQDMKCFDLIDNTSTIAVYDHDFAKTYLPEKREILSGFVKARPELLKMAWDILQGAEKVINS